MDILAYQIPRLFQKVLRILQNDGLPLCIMWLYILLLLLVFWILDTIMDVVWHLSVVLNFSSPITYDVKYIFICLLCIFSEVVVTVFGPFINWAFHLTIEFVEFFVYFMEQSFIQCDFFLKYSLHKLISLAPVCYIFS